MPRDGGASVTAVARLRAGCLAYLDFAEREPGLYRSVFLTDEAPADLRDPKPASIGAAGRGPYQQLEDVLDDLVASGDLAAPDRPWSDLVVWAAMHGLALLLLDGPPRHLDREQRAVARDRLLDVVVAGLTRDHGHEHEETS